MVVVGFLAGFCFLFELFVFCGDVMDSRDGCLPPHFSFVPSIKAQHRSYIDLHLSFDWALLSPLIVWYYKISVMLSLLVAIALIACVGFGIGCRDSFLA